MVLSPRRLVTAALTILIGFVLISTIGGCSLVEKADPRPEPSRARGFDLQVPTMMRGTVASVAILEGYRPVIVRGYGLVVGLNGHGSSDIPPQLRTQLIQEAGRRGIGLEHSGFGHLSPERLLDSTDTAVVVVEGVIPAGSSKGSRFDLRVYAHPMTSTTSLEGGRLYSTDLRQATRVGLPPVGSRQGRILASGNGPVFVNPFAEPGAIERDTVIRTVGKVLQGGAVGVDLQMTLRLASPNHTRAEILQNAINAQYPQERRQRFRTAHGQSDEVIQITVPPSYRDDPSEFVELLKHTTMVRSGAEQMAMTVRRHLLSNPETASSAAWRWQALGKRALPVVKDLYDYPEESPRMAALSAGAKLGDGQVVPHLIVMAKSGATAYRIQAIELLKRMPSNPIIDKALRDMLSDSDVEIRLRAYESLVDRRDPLLRRKHVDDKFVIDFVESDQNMVYVTQVGEPRLVVFGQSVAVSQPITMNAWSQRFMLIGDLDDQEIEVYYRSQNDLTGYITLVKPELGELIHFLGHTTSVRDPRPGLGLDYGETVGLLHQIWRQGYLDADFKAEQDRLLLAIADQEAELEVNERPEFADADLQGQDTMFDTGDLTSDLDRLSPLTLPPSRDPGVPRTPKRQP